MANRKRNPAACVGALACAATMLIPIALFSFSAQPQGSAAQAPAGRVLFQDDLDKTRNWDEGDFGPCHKEYTEGGFLLGAIGKGVTCEVDLLKVGVLPARVRIEVTLRLLKGSQTADFGLKFGATKSTKDPYYTYCLDATGHFQLALWNGSRWIFLIRRAADAAVREGYGASNRIAVEIEGRRIRCFVNGKMVGEAATPLGTGGYMGFTLDQTGMEAVFNDLRVSELPAAYR